ncbi:hypothetical protein LCGC14_2072750 [marine sediment metagenome]|uniref:Uncharacterized protein n=1 Tax=marine sediment metagenome TaxID=412755 RepID=A0A0F9F586_9ZZZZ
MVFYYQDLNLSNRVIPILLLLTFSLPFLIYFRNKGLALLVAVILAIVQLVAIIGNVKRLPL